MNHILKINKATSPQKITKAVKQECRLADCDDLEDISYLIGLSLGPDALEYNPERPGTLRAEAWDIGVRLSQIPMDYEHPERSEDAEDTDSGGGSSAVPGFLQDRDANTMHSSNSADIMASREDDLMVMGVATLLILSIGIILWTLPF